MAQPVKGSKNMSNITIISQVKCVEIIYMLGVFYLLRTAQLTLDTGKLLSVTVIKFIHETYTKHSAGEHALPLSSVAAGFHR